MTILFCINLNYVKLKIMDDNLIEKIFTKIEKICKSDKEQIDEIIHNWFIQNHKGESKRYFFKENSKTLLKYIDLNKSRKDYKYIQFYNDLIQLEFLTEYDKDLNFKNFYISNFNKYRPESNLPSDETKLFIDYIAKEKKYLQTVSCILKLKKELNIPFSIFEIINDINGSRIILKKYIFELLNNYNIPLNDSALKLLFSKHKLRNGEIVDTIKLFTYGTWFSNDLKSQFTLTSRGNANGIFTSFFLRAGGYLEVDQNERIKNENEIPNCFDPFVQEQKTIRILAKIFYISNNYPEMVKQI